MAPGPPNNLFNNKFFALEVFIENSSKKAKRNDFPALPIAISTQKNSPKYILINFTDDKK